MGMGQIIFSCYERDSVLHRLNPVLKLTIAFVFMLTATFLFDIQTLTVLFLTVFSVTLCVGKIPFTVLCRGLIPFFVLGLGYLWMNAIFPRNEDKLLTVVFELGPIKLIEEGIFTGIAMTIRALCFGACSLLFITTTDPSDFIISLILQARIIPRIAFGTMAAYRFLPLLETELGQIRTAHRLRGLGEGEGLRGKLTQMYRYTIPLLASAIRKAGRVAIAMESRGFVGQRDRTYYRRPQLGGLDWAFGAGALVVLGGILMMSRSLKWMQIWEGGLGF